jgi:DNA-directed RNA polymerase subunit E'/Rpb7
MDPLFERRQLTKKVHIYSKFLQKNMNAVILAQLKMNVEGKCSSEGFIQRNSITILEYSLGRTNYIKGGVDYDITFQADICFPHRGQQLKAPMTLKSKVGIHAELPPLKILIPRDLHLGNKEFDEVKEGEDLEFEVVGSTFKQKDTEIVVVGKLLSRPDDVVLVKEEDEKQVVVTPKEPEESGESVKQVVFAPPTEGAVVVKGKRKKLTGNTPLKEETNE